MTHLSHPLLGVTLVLLAGCATAGHVADTRPDDPASAPAAEPATESGEAEADAQEPDEEARAATMPPPLPARVEGGTIPRAALLQILSAGVPRFLQQVPVEAVRPSGEFLGWRVLGLFESQPAIAQHSIIQPGDIVVRINRHSLERPEQFKTVWDSLASGSEIVIDIVRGDQPSRIHYSISDDNLGTADPPE